MQQPSFHPLIHFGGGKRVFPGSQFEILEEFSHVTNSGGKAEISRSRLISKVFGEGKAGGCNEFKKGIVRVHMVVSSRPNVTIFLGSLYLLIT